MQPGWAAPTLRKAVALGYFDEKWLETFKHLRFQLLF